MALGGRVAEEVVFGAEQITTGASNDLQQVWRVVRLVVLFEQPLDRRLRRDQLLLPAAGVRPRRQDPGGDDHHTLRFCEVIN